MAEPEVVVDGIPVTINGVEVTAARGELLIDVAERAGAYIPRFCYHPRMKPVGMCRMCLVEVDTGRGPTLQPSCMLECTPGMVVETESPASAKAQEGVLEFLLVNHPLDCPVCDKGGECPLQDQAVSHGPGESRMVEEKRHYEKPIPISDLVLLDRERCILCDRCTRFAKDVAGEALIHFQQRGNQTEVNTFPDAPFASYYSGNTVQICPVGALTASAYRFKARPWDLDKVESTCTTCSVGCRTSLESSRDELLRVNGVDVDPVNWGWLCDKGRFGFESVHADGRLVAPMVRSGDALAEARWSTALRTAADAIRDALTRGGPRAVGVLGGARLTNESAYAWAKLAKGVIATDNVDAQLGDGLPASIVLGTPRATIDEALAPGSTVVLMAPDLREELPVLYLRLRHAVLEDGVRLIELAPAHTSATPLASVVLHHRPGEAAEVARALAGHPTPGRDAGGVEPAELEAARALLAAGGATLVLGRPSLGEDAAYTVDAAEGLLAAFAGMRVLPALRRGNVLGALEAGLCPGFLPGRATLADGTEWFRAAWPAVPHDAGLDALGMLRAAADGELDVLVLLGADPLSDVPDRDLARRALARVGTVIAVAASLDDSASLADVVLPAAGHGEVAGTTTNLEGRVSPVAQKVTPPGTARDDWMIASDLARLLGVDLGVTSPADIRAELDELSTLHRGWVEALGLDAGARGVVLPVGTPGAADAEPEVGPEAPTGDAVAADTIVDATADETADGADGAEGAEPDADGGPGEPAIVGPTPPPLAVHAPSAPVEAPPHDAYGLRLVVTRTLYDDGVLVRRSRSLVGLAPGTDLRLHPLDFDRLGVDAGSTVAVRTARGQLDLAVHPDAGVPRGAALVRANQPGVDVTGLLDSAARVADVRIDTGGAR